MYSKSVTGTTHQLRFAVGQLAVAIIGLNEEDPKHGFIGKIMAIEGEMVLLRAYDGDQEEVLLENLKQAVHYDIDKPHAIGKGMEATVFAIDHPASHIGPNRVVYTSEVLTYNKMTGFFETRNTCYMANRVEHPLFGTKLSPFLPL